MTDASVNYVYICSAGHSGSTLLDLLLGSHTRMGTLGEISHLSKNLSLNTRCTCGEPVQMCAVWQEAAAEINRRLGIDVLANPYALNMGYSKATDVVDRAHQNAIYLFKRKVILGLYYLNLRLGLGGMGRLLQPIRQSMEHTFLVYDVMRKVLGVDIIIDSSKEYLRAVSVYQQAPERTRVILLTRDGRGVFYSNLKRNYAQKYSLNSWKLHYSRALPLLARYIDSHHLLHVKYEDLAGNPAAESERICNFLGLEYEPGMLDFAAKVHHSTNGNNMRFSKTSEIRLDTSWQDSMSEEQRRYFELEAGQLNRRLGYR